MKKITMFYQRTCPYCIAAQRYMETLIAENPGYASLEVEKIDERAYPEVARKYNYYYVPTYYVGDEKIHEGAAGLEKIRLVFDAAMKD